MLLLVPASRLWFPAAVGTSRAAAAAAAAVAITAASAVLLSFSSSSAFPPLLLPAPAPQPRRGRTFSSNREKTSNNPPEIRSRPLRTAGQIIYPDFVSDDD